MGRCRRCRRALLVLLAGLFGPVVETARADERGPAGIELPAGLRLRPGGFVQADAGLYRADSTEQLDPSTGRPLNEERFAVRRAHLRLDMAWRFAEGAIEIEGTTSPAAVVRLFDAEVSARWPFAVEGPPLVMVSAGLMRTPFGGETQVRDVDRLFLERSAIGRALFPGVTDLGVRLQGGWRILRWQLAVMNGHPTGERAFPQLDPTSSKDLLGRLGVDALAFRRLHVQLGASALRGTGFHAGTAGTKDRIEWRDDNGDGVVQPSELHPLLGVAATPSETFDRWALGLDGLLALVLPVAGALTLYGELTWAENLDRGIQVADPIATGRDLRELGWSLGVTQELTRWVLVGVRFDRYDPDADARAQLGVATVPADRSMSTWAFAVAVQAPPFLRLVVEYDRNRNALAIDDGGRPTTLDADAVTARAQLAF